ncbi:MAG TPA: NUDIX hydrolase, partial [Candidatus Limnocylindrales bacterium]|nr:NUDIX hydrolase [Candidatus Limnocylindrales bacterium]
AVLQAAPLRRGERGEPRLRARGGRRLSDQDRRTDQAAGPAHERAGGGDRTDPEPPLDPGPPDDELVERVVDSRVLHHGRYLTFRIDTIERPDGSRSERDIAGHPGAVAIVAIDAADRVLLVRQWRTPADGVLLEIPAGTLDRDPATGKIEDPELASRRELEEETGDRAATWQKLAAFWTAPGFATELMHLYLATDLTPAHPDERRGPDEDEHLRLERLPFADALAALDRGEIADAKSIAGLLWVDRLRRRVADDR